MEKNKVKGGLSSVFGRVGGKKLLKKTIVDDYFPEDYENMIYVEPFVGAGNILFYKNPSVKEIINDKDEDVVLLLNGFKHYDGNKISKDINGKYDKASFEKLKAFQPKSDYQKFIKKLIMTKTSFFGKGESYGVKTRPYISSNYGHKYNDRLKDVIIKNEDYKKIIKKYDSDNTFFYLDPPYENSDNLYKHDTVSIKELFHLLDNIKGLFLMSYNDSDEARRLFKDYNIYEVKTKYADTQSGSQTRKKKELLISNYDL